MKNNVFTFNIYGREKVLRIGQKVECVYYHEYDDNVDSYKRSPLSKLIDKPFRPVKLGVIIGDAGVHPYWLAKKNKRERYLLVRFSEYRLPKPIPISCIEDVKQEAERNKEFIINSVPKMDEKGHDLDSLLWLMNLLKKEREFLELEIPQIKPR